jgi:hypothetical protein
MSDQAQATPMVETPNAPQTPQGSEAQAPTPEAPKEHLSSKFAALARKEKAALQKMQQAKQIEAELKAREAKIAELESKLNERESWFGKAKENPDEALQRLGLSYSDLTDYYLNGKKVTPDLQVKAMEDKFNSFVKQQEEKEKLAAEESKKRAQQEHEQTIAQFRKQVTDFVSSKPEQYELINMFDSSELVIATIEAHFEKTQQVLSNEEASNLVEKFLEEQVEKSVQSKKFQGKFTKATPSQDGQPQKSPAGSKTLTNNVTSSAPSLLPARTEQDRLQRALAALNKG